jgi:hypothetical protein
MYYEYIYVMYILSLDPTFLNLNLEVMIIMMLKLSDVFKIASFEHNFVHFDTVSS